MYFFLYFVFAQTKIMEIRFNRLIVNPVLKAIRVAHMGLSHARRHASMMCITFFVEAKGGHVPGKGRLQWMLANF